MKEHGFFVCLFTLLLFGGGFLVFFADCFPNFYTHRSVWLTCLRNKTLKKKSCRLGKGQTKNLLMWTKKKKKRKETMPPSIQLLTPQFTSFLLHVSSLTVGHKFMIKKLVNTKTNSEQSWCTAFGLGYCGPFQWKLFSDILRPVLIPTRSSTGNLNKFETAWCLVCVCKAEMMILNRRPNLNRVKCLFLEPFIQTYYKWERKLEFWHQYFQVEQTLQRHSL